MNDLNDDDNNLDLQLREHFAKELDGQLGRAPAAFARSSRRRPWRVVGRVTAMAAAVALLVVGSVIVRNMLNAKNDLVVSIPPTTTAAAEIAVEYSISWQSTDEGTVFMSDTPLRGIRQERVETFRWVDPETHASYEVSIPQEETIYVALNAI